MKSLLKEDKSYRLSHTSIESIKVQDAAPHEVILSRSQQISAEVAATPLDRSSRSMGSRLNLEEERESTPLLRDSPATTLTRAFSNPISVAEIDFGRYMSKREEREIIHVQMHPEAPDKINIDMRLVQCAHDEMSKREPWATDVLEIAEDIELEEEAEAYHSQHLLVWPKYGSVTEKFFYIVNFPLHVLITFTIPSGPRWYFGALALSMLWLSGVSYLLSFCSQGFGNAMLIPDSIVGLTVDSAGSSLPNLLAAVAAGKSGRSETAICQAFGSNTFDAFIAFGLIKFIQSALTNFRPIQIAKGEGFEQGIVIDLILLALYVWFMYFFRCRLTRAFGGTCIFLYFAWLGYQFYVVLN